MKTRNSNNQTQPTVTINNQFQPIVVKSQKSRLIAALLAFFLGGFGIQWFYLNRNILGIFSLLFFWTGIPAVIALFHTIVLLVVGDEKFNEKYNTIKPLS